MFDPLNHLLYAVTGFALFFGTVPLFVALMRRDHHRVDQILDLYIEVFHASVAAIIGALRIFRRKDRTEVTVLPPDTDPNQITKQ
jgi:hypothetical protein